MGTMTTQTELDTRHKIMAEPLPQQGLVDKLTALVLLGTVDFYAAKQATNDGDWARELIEEAT